MKSSEIIKKLDAWNEKLKNNHSKIKCRFSLLGNAGEQKIICVPTDKAQHISSYVVLNIRETTSTRELDNAITNDLKELAELFK